MPTSGFSLTKWYLDGTSADGRAFIAYWASISWRAISINWQDLWVFSADGSAMHRSSLARGAPPRWVADALEWSSDGIQGTIGFQPTCAPVRARLLDGDGGYVQWNAEAPAATVSAGFAGFLPFEGAGYAECVEMTVPPWRLPIRELRWGRWLDATAERSVVWIDWRGELNRTWVFADGTLEAASQVGDSELTIGDSRLELTPQRTLHERNLGEVIDRLPLLRAAVPESVLAMRQSKWLSEGVLRKPTGEPSVGLAIHELVVFR